MVVQAFNPALERIIKQDETALRYSLILRVLEARSLQIEVEVRVSGWLLLF